MNPDRSSTLQLSVTSSEATPLEKKWLEECRKLYLEIDLKLEQGSVRPINMTASTGDRGFPADYFGNLLLTGVNLGVFAGLYNLLKLWLENRKTCEVTITYPDGFTIKVSRISLDEALELHKKHNREAGKGIIRP